MTARTQHRQPAGFAGVAADLRAAQWRPEIVIEEMPSPQRIAPFSVALGADVVVGGDDIGSGRLVLLHDPVGNEAWRGTYRCVTFAKAQVEPEMVRDPLLADVGWSWLIDALSTHDAEFTEASGTVTAVISTPFGELAGDPGNAEVEIRASWTPLLEDGQSITAHLAAWQDLLCMTAGLPPIPPGVVALQTKRPRR